MYFTAETKEPAEVHNQRPPTHGIDMGPQSIAFQQFFIYVQLHNVHFEGIGVHVFTESAKFV